MVPARRCGRWHAAAINAVPGPNGSNSGGAPMSRRSHSPTRMHECCGPYSEAAKLIERHPFPFRLLVERYAAEEEPNVRAESKVQVPMSQMVPSPSAGPPSRYARNVPANAALDRGLALGCGVIMQSRGATAALHSHSILAEGQYYRLVTSLRLRRPYWRAEWRTGRTGTFQTCRRFGAHLSPRI